MKRVKDSAGPEADCRYLGHATELAIISSVRGGLGGLSKNVGNFVGVYGPALRSVTSRI